MSVYLLYTSICMFVFLVVLMLVNKDTCVSVSSVFLVC